MDHPIAHSARNRPRAPKKPYTRRQYRRFLMHFVAVVLYPVGDALFAPLLLRKRFFGAKLAAHAIRVATAVAIISLFILRLRDVISLQAYAFATVSIGGVDVALNAWGERLMRHR